MSIDYDSLLTSFISESNDMLSEAEGSILTLESGFDEDLVNSVFRIFHTIKGDSGIFGYQKITDLAHAMENLLSLMRSQTIDITMERTDLLLTGVDRLRRLINNSNSLDSIEVKDIMERLREEINLEAAPVKEHKSVAGQNVIKQQRDSNNSGNLHIRIPARFKEWAIADNEYLSLMYLDLFKQNFSSLLEIRALLEDLEKRGHLLMQGVLMNLLPGLSNNKGAILPYYMLLKTQTVASGFMKENALQGKVLKILHDPSAVVSSSVQPPLHNEMIAGEKVETPTADPGQFVDGEDVQKSVGSLSKTTNESQSGAVQSPNKKDTTEEKNNAQPNNSATETKGDTHLKVHVDLLDELISLAGETIIARNDLLQRVDNIKEPGLIVATKKVSALITKLQENIMRTRLQEINTVFQRLPRIVRDVSKMTGKKIELITEGGEVELDKTLIDAVIDPVMHMVRNSIDHGIELPEERRKAGKPEKGQLKLNAALRGGNVVLKIIDDGKGIDADKIREKALDKGMLSEQEAMEKADHELFELLFEAGFSTAASVTQVSGRGVGMDVVRSNLKRIGSSIDITSEKGKGTVFTAVLPQTLSVITSLLVVIGDKLYAIPQQNIEELILVDEEQIVTIEGHLMYKQQGHLLPLVHTASLLYPGREVPDEIPYIAVVRSDRHLFGLIIEEIMTPAEIVVKPMGEHFSDLMIFSGAAIMGDGEAVLIVDIPGLARFANIQPNLLDDEDGEEFVDLVEFESDGYVLFEVNNENFAVPVSSVPKIEKISSDAIEQFMGLETFQFNSQIVPLVRLENVFHLGEPIKDQQLNVMIFEVEDMKVGIVASRIYRVVNALATIERGAFLGSAIVGQTIFEGRKVVVIDVMVLLAEIKETRFQQLDNYLNEEQIHFLTMEQAGGQDIAVESGIGRHNE